MSTSGALGFVSVWKSVAVRLAFAIAFVFDMSHNFNTIKLEPNEHNHSRAFAFIILTLYDIDGPARRTSALQCKIIAY
jgi:hypothetical protein